MGLFNFFTQEIAMDLGTANTLIIFNDEVVVNEPSIVALDRNNPKNILAVGKKALMMHEKTHESIRTVRPLKDGVIADFNAAELMIREMIKMIYPKKATFCAKLAHDDLHPQQHHRSGKTCGKGQCRAGRC
jgi:rod shape-determining protein MreB